MLSAVRLLWSEPSEFDRTEPERKRYQLSGALPPDAFLPFQGADELSTAALFGRAQSLAARWRPEDIDEVVPALRIGILKGEGARLAVRLAVELARSGRVVEARAIARGVASAIRKVCREAAAVAKDSNLIPEQREDAVAPAAAVLPALAVLSAIEELAELRPARAASVRPLNEAASRLIEVLPVLATTDVGALAICAELRRRATGQVSGLDDLARKAALRAYAAGEVSVASRVNPGLDDRAAEALVEAAARVATASVARGRGSMGVTALRALESVPELLRLPKPVLAEATAALARMAAGADPTEAASRLGRALKGAGGAARCLAAAGVALVAARPSQTEERSELRRVLVAIGPDARFPVDLLERLGRARSRLLLEEDEGITDTDLDAPRRTRG